MQIELSAETISLAQAMVDNGQFRSIEEAVHAAIRDFAGERAEWLTYARASIHDGLEDVAAGRMKDGDAVMRRLKERARRAAA